MISEERRDLEASLARLQQEHRDLDAAIEALHGMPGSDLLQLQPNSRRILLLEPDGVGALGAGRRSDLSSAQRLAKIHLQ
ncbi:MAG: DUF465 domain-containing protein [Rhizobiales bacterium]|nr:DUF465 domain-containing protein [Hyphomicrobiales bacterium]